MTLAELKQLDAAHKWSNDGGQTFPYRGQAIRVPTLEELFLKFPQMRYVIEIKLTQNPIDRPLCDLIREHDMQDKVIVASFHDEAMRSFRETCPEVATSASRTEVRNFVLLGKAFLSGFIAPQYRSIQPPYDPKESMNIPIMTERFIREAHAKNIRVEPWTVDDPELMEQYIEWGVDGIMTDRPDLMIQMLEEIGIR
jgi:glycerophosphoryl diester phosphodiesterase